MPNRITNSTLNASTMDILNVIRANASAEYQDKVPKIDKATDIPKVGEILMGHPSLGNQFISALVNRIVAVQMKSAIFNNPYVGLKKGAIRFGETVEEIFVQIAKARTFNPEKAESRELKRTLPDVRTAFHAMNWRVQYPITVTEADLQKAFLSMEGVQDLIARLVDSVYKAAEYDEFLLFKYLLIKGANAQKITPVKLADEDMKTAAVAFRSKSNAFTFMSDKYNAAGVLTTTPREKQIIFMDSEFSARYDVEVLAAAFNMSKADFMGRLYLIDDFTSFDNERFDVIRSESDMIDEVTPEELEAMAGVKAVLMDADWFQVYDNVLKMCEKYVASGDYWNYFYRVEKTISWSPFANAISFTTADNTDPETINGTVVGVDKADKVTMLTVELTEKVAQPEFIQTKEATTAGIAVHRYGVYIIPDGKSTTPQLKIASGQVYNAGGAVTKDTAIGAALTFSKAVAAAATANSRSRKA